jgi:hypothetical protein
MPRYHVPGLAAALTARYEFGPAKPFREMYDLLVGYHREFGHAPSMCTVYRGHHLGEWKHTQQCLRRAKRLPVDHAALLEREALWAWNDREADHWADFVNKYQSRTGFPDYHTEIGNRYLIAARLVLFDALPRKCLDTLQHTRPGYKKDFVGYLYDHHARARGAPPALVGPPHERALAAAALRLGAAAPDDYYRATWDRHFGIAVQTLYAPGVFDWLALVADSGGAGREEALVAKYARTDSFEDIKYHRFFGGLARFAKAHKRAPAPGESGEGLPLGNWYVIMRLLDKFRLLNDTYSALLKSVFE